MDKEILKKSIKIFVSLAVSAVLIFSFVKFPAKRSGKFEKEKNAAASGAALQKGELPLPGLYLGAYSFEIRDAVGRLNAPLTVAKLKEGNMNFYNYLIWHFPSDWQDLEIFLKKTLDKNISVIVDLAPPWVGDPKRSEPFKEDYQKWAHELADLSRRYPQLIGYTIDDWYFISSVQPANQYPSNWSQGVDSGRMAGKEINPDFKFYPTVYNDCSKGMNADHPVDGVLLYPEGVISSNAMPNEDHWKKAIDSCKEIFPNDTIVGIYSVTVEGFEQKYADETDANDADIVAKKVELALARSPRGVMMYGLQWHGTVWDRIREVFRQNLPAAAF